VILEISGEFDLASAPQVRAALAHAEALSPELLVVDLAGLEHVDSSAVAILYLASARARAAGRRLALSRCRPAARRLFQRLGLDGVIEMIDEPPK